MKPSVIATNAILTGDIKTDDPLIVYGTVDGNVESSNVLTIYGQVLGTVTAPCVLTKDSTIWARGYAHIMRAVFAVKKHVKFEKK